MTNLATKKILLNTIGALMLLGVNWVILNSFGKTWKFVILWIGMAIIICVIGVSIPAFKRRAYLYYLVTSLIWLSISLGLLDVTNQFFVAPESREFLYSVFLLSIWGVFLFSIILERHYRLNVSKEYLIETGKYNLSKSSWNLEMTLHLQDPKEDEKIYSRLRRIGLLSPLIPPIAFYINRNFDPEIVHLTLAISNYIMAIGASLVLGYFIALCLVVLEWEKESGNNIMIQSNGN